MKNAYGKRITKERRKRKKMKQLKQRKGITLVALVITIIVLLILAGITISLTIGEDGIIRRAQEAGRNYQEAAQNENTQLAEFTNMADDIIANVTGGSTTPTIDPSVLALKVGDYVKYDSGANGVITCRVLYPVTSEYGLQIISNKNVKQVTLGGSDWNTGKTAYNNAISDLNNYAEDYINTEFAYDGRCVGSLPTVSKGMFIDKDKHNGETGTVSIPNSYTLPTGWTSTDTGCVKGDTNSATDKKQLTTNKIFSDGAEFWLASRISSNDGDAVNFGVEIIGLYGELMMQELGGKRLCRVYFGSVGTSVIGDSGSYGLRPCISLKSDIIKITGGDGTSEETAYIIGK